MSTLYTFGDSFTQGHHNFEDFPAYSQYKALRGGKLFDLWPTILANKLNFKLENYGEAGSSNDGIFSSVCKNINKFKKNDIVIIGWTFIIRFRWVLENGNWQTMHVGPYKDITDSTREEILVNRTHCRYAEIIYEYEQIIDRISQLVGFDVYYWLAENNLISNLDDYKQQRKYILNKFINPYESLLIEIYRRGGKRIKEESNNMVNDIHLGESGHQIQGELFYNYIKELDEKPVQYIPIIFD